jgi:hypothetical protein
MRVETLEAGLAGAPRGRRTGEPSAAAGACVPAGGEDAAQLSRMARLLKDLQDLELQAPDRYRLAMGTISGHLEAAAGAGTGGSAELLRALSRKFGEAAGAAAATAGRGTVAARAHRSSAARPGPAQLEEILQAALAEVGADGRLELPPGIALGKK